MANTLTASDRVADRVRLLRTEQRITIAQLAERCAADMPELTAQVLYRIEQRGRGGRKARPVTVDELVVLAQALGVTPLALLGEDENPGLFRRPIPFEELDNVIESLTVFRSLLDSGIVGRSDG